ncbi:hypothetical protein Tco_0128887 [Tanacetum coccineum]
MGLNAIRRIDQHPYGVLTTDLYTAYPFLNTPYPPSEQKVVRYTEKIVHDFKQRFETTFGRQVNRVHILDFKGLTPDMRQDLAERLRMVYTGYDGQEVFVSHAWRRLFRIRAPLVQEFILEFFSTCRIGDEIGTDLEHTSLVSDDGLRGLLVVACELSLIDMGELRQPDAAAGAPGAAEDVPAVDEDAQVDPAPVQAPQSPPLLLVAGPRCKEIDEVGEVSIIWNPMCDCSHAGIQTHLQHTSLLINSTWRIY